MQEVTEAYAQIGVDAFPAVDQIDVVIDVEDFVD